MIRESVYRVNNFHLVTYLIELEEIGILALRGREFFDLIKEMMLSHWEKTLNERIELHWYLAVCSYHNIAGILNPFYIYFHPFYPCKSLSRTIPPSDMSNYDWSPDQIPPPYSILEQDHSYSELHKCFVPSYSLFLRYYLNLLLQYRIDINYFLSKLHIFISFTYFIHSFFISLHFISHSNLTNS